MSTAKMLNSGTEATIISGEAPALPYMFITKATPMTAGLPR